MNINFKAVLRELENIESYIANCDFETACKMLNGYNNYGDLFDFAWEKDGADFIATIHNHDGKPVIEDDSFIELYENYNDDLPVLELSRDEIREQVERLGLNEEDDDDNDNQ